MSRVGPRSLMAACSVLAASACYSYQPIEIDEIAPQTEVRARVSARFAEENAPILGREQRLLEGAVEAVNGDGLMLLVPVVSQFERRGGGLNQRLTIPGPDLLEVEMKERDNLRTGIVVGLVSAIGGAIIYQAITGDETAANDPIRDPPDEDRVIRIPISIRW